MKRARPRDSLSAYNERTVLNARAIMEHEDAVLVDWRRDPDAFEVLRPGRWERAKVKRNGDEWSCNIDKPNKGYNQDHPCSHILVAMMHAGVVDAPNSAENVWRKGRDARNHRAENNAWQRVPTRFPQLLARLLEQALPVIKPKRRLRRGQQPKPLYPLLYQAVHRVHLRQSLRMARGSMNTLDHQQHNPEGSCGVATLSRFLASPLATVLLEKLLALSTWPVKPYETLVHPDGTGLSEEHFSSYFDERYGGTRRWPKGIVPKAAAGDVLSRSISRFIEEALVGAIGKGLRRPGPRSHRWSYAEILWTYRYTMVAALHADDGPFGEARWLIPLLKRAGLMLDVGELGGDKAYSTKDIFRYAVSHGIDPQVKFKDNATGGKSSWRSRDFKRTLQTAKRDPDGYAAKSNRRNNAETGNHALKAFLGGEVYSLGHTNPRTRRVEFTARRNEILCMALAYNLTRLVYVEAERDLTVDFADGVAALAGKSWRSLSELARQAHAEGYKVPDEARAEWAKRSRD